MKASSKKQKLTLASSTSPIIIDLGTYIYCSEGCFYGMALDWNLMGNTLLRDYHMQFFTGL
jgi:hypothetical protein